MEAEGLQKIRILFHASHFPLGWISPVPRGMHSDKYNEVVGEGPRKHWCTVRCPVWPCFCSDINKKANPYTILNIGMCMHTDASAYMCIEATSSPQVSSLVMLQIIFGDRESHQAQSSLIWLSWLAL